MDDKQKSREARFDSFLNKTIIYSSKKYFRKQMREYNIESPIVDDEKFSSFLQSFIDLTSPSSEIDKLEFQLQFNSALASLSAIEQAVLFLLYNEELSQAETAEILEIYSKTVSKIKIRAVEKLKKYFREDFGDEK